MRLPFIKRPILWLILFMSISLLGIIMVQFYWIKQAIEVQKNQITSEIYDALRTSTMRLEKEQRTNSFLKSRGINPQKFKRGERRHRERESSKSPFNTHIYLSDNGVEVRTEQIQNTTQNEWQDRGLNGEAKNSDQQIESLIPFTNTSQADEQERILLDWFMQMNNEMNGMFNPLPVRLNMEQLKEILTDEFTQRGVTSKFEYGVIDKSTLEPTKFCSNKFNPAEQFNCFTIPLFPREIFRGNSPYFLQVNFKDLNTIIFSSIGWVMGASMVFTLFILVAFFLTIKTILSQKRISEIKNDFINNMTHELKTPLATISLATDSISNSSIISNPERITPLLSIIKEENKRMNKHVERILQLSLLEKKNLQLYKSETNIKDLITKVVDRMKLLVEQGGGSITLKFNHTLDTVMVDDVHFTNVIHNLIDNAIKYSENAPNIVIKTAIELDKLVISISDNGIGLTKDQKDKIFEKFYRVHTGNQHNVKGFGLGLSYVKAIVLLHNGTISIDSKLGEGSTFTIKIPTNTNI